jgi:uncharacterized protein YhbP (UPF0306 family)
MLDGRSSRVREQVRLFLSERFVLAMGTGQNQRAAGGVCYFAGDLAALYFLSSPEARHGRNPTYSPSLAAAINEDEHDRRLIRSVRLEGAYPLAASPRVWRRGWWIDLSRFPVAHDLFRGRVGGVVGRLRRTRLYVVRMDRDHYPAPLRRASGGAAA